MKNILFSLLLIMALISCQNEKKTENPEADQKQIEFTLQNNDQGIALVNDFTKETGTDPLETSIVNFKLAEKNYQITRNCGFFEIKTSEISDQKDTITYKLDNLVLTKWVNNKAEAISDNQKRTMTKTLFKIAYFAEFPFGFKSSGVRKRYLGEDEIEGQIYKKLKLESITNYDDYNTRFTHIVWMDNSDKPAFIATDFGDGSKLDFRVVKNQSKVQHILFSDYESYVSSDSVDLDNLAKTYEANELTKQSNFKLDRIKVEIVGRNCD